MNDKNTELGHLPVRVKAIEDIDSQELESSLDSARFFYSPEEIKTDIEKAVIDHYQNAGNIDQILAKRLLERRSADVAEFLSSEIVRIATLLRLSSSDIEASSMFIFNIDEVDEATHETTDNGYHIITFPTFRLLSLLRADLNEVGDAELYARASKTLAHEFFHAYIALRYPTANEKSLEANDVFDENRSNYDKDRGEIACDLFALKHLMDDKSEVVDLLCKDDEEKQILRDGYQTEISLLEEKLRQRTAHLEQ